MTHSFTFFSIPLCMSFFNKGGLIKLMNEMHDNTCARLTACEKRGFSQASDVHRWET